MNSVKAIAIVHDSGSAMLHASTRRSFDTLIQRLKVPALAIIAGLAFSIGAGPVIVAPAPVASAPFALAAVPQERPPVPAPVVEPVALQALAPDTAQNINAAVAFSRAPNPAARPFVLSGSPDQQVRATDCLASAVWYEAGDEATGERAVAQVVLNRVRHPSFPKTLCGVVFQGAERLTGCQFSFTCDGSIRRRAPSAAAWQRAQAIAGAAVRGAVYAPVGYATHYHTDWVVPYWSASLDKIAAVDTHLFFRWHGWWGTPRVFHAPVSVEEPVIAVLAAVSVAHRAAPPGAPTIAVASAAPVGADPQTIDGSGVAGIVPRFVPTATNPDIFLVLLPASFDRERYPDLAARACGDRVRCVFMAWTDAGRMPAGLPASTSQLQDMAFHFLRDPGLSAVRTRWNCAAVRRPDPAQCLSHQVVQRPSDPARADATAAGAMSGPAKS